MYQECPIRLVGGPPAGPAPAAAASNRTTPDRRRYEELANVSVQARSYGLPFELSDLVRRFQCRALMRYGRSTGSWSPPGAGNDAGPTSE